MKNVPELPTDILREIYDKVDGRTKARMRAMDRRARAALPDPKLGYNKGSGLYQSKYRSLPKSILNLYMKRRAPRPKDLLEFFFYARDRVYLPTKKADDDSIHVVAGPLKLPFSNYVLLGAMPSKALVDRWHEFVVDSGVVDSGVAAVARSQYATEVFDRVGVKLPKRKSVSGEMFMDAVLLFLMREYQLERENAAIEDQRINTSLPRRERKDWADMFRREFEKGRRQRRADAERRAAQRAADRSKPLLAPGKGAPFDVLFPARKNTRTVAQRARNAASHPAVTRPSRTGQVH